jgi:hypothetical protein
MKTYGLWAMTTLSLFLKLTAIPALADCDHPQKIEVPNTLVEISQLPAAQSPAWNATQTTLKVYAPERPVTQGQAIIVPPTGGENFLDRHLSSELCKAGITAFTLNYVSAYPVVTLDLSVHDLATEEFLAQLEKTLRYFPNPTVIVGSSLGGLLSSIAYGMASQAGFTNGFPLSFQPTQTIALLRGASLTVSGGELAGVLADSQVDGVVAQRKLRMTHDGLNRNQYEEELNKEIRLDTLALANPKAAKSVQFFEGLLDEDVPTQYQNNLWSAWGKPNRESFPLGHKETIFLVYELRSCAIRDFVLGLLK